MLSVIQTALGGILHNQRGLQVTADNIANVNTDGYRTQRLDANTGQPAPDAKSPQPRPPDWPESYPYNDVDLATEIVQMKAYEVGVKANAKVVSVADKLLGELMDTLA